MFREPSEVGVEDAVNNERSSIALKQSLMYVTRNVFFCGRKSFWPVFLLAQL